MASPGLAEVGLTDLVTTGFGRFSSIVITTSSVAVRLPVSVTVRVKVNTVAADGALKVGLCAAGLLRVTVGLPPVCVQP